jgi:hypothetical protein
MSLDDELRDALQGEADEARPPAHGWEDLQERVGGARRGHGRWLTPVLAAAAALVLLAAGAWVLTRDDDVTIGVTDSSTTTAVVTTTPSTTIGPGGMTSVPGMTVPPGTSVVPPEPTTIPPSAPPTTIVAVTVDGRVVVLDAATGNVVRQLADLGDPRVQPAEGPGPNAVTQITVTPDGSTAYYDSCCEPAAGMIFSVPTDGSREPEPLTHGLGPAVSPDGRYLAFTLLDAVVVRDLTTGDEQTFTDPAYTEQPLFGDVTWSVDGTKLYYPWERRNPDGTAAGSALVELEVRPGATPRVLFEDPTRALSHPMSQSDRIVTVLAATLGPDGFPGPQDTQYIVDVATAQVTQNEASRTTDRSWDPGSQSTLTVGEDGRLIAGDTPLGEGYALAVW